MDLTTQLGGSYRPDNHALFAVKKKLQDAGILVRHPMTEEFVTDGEKTYGYNPEAWSREEVELDQLGSIATCDVHIVCNELADQMGYIGPDTARCLLYALLKNKPVILLHRPFFDQQVDKRTAKIIGSREALFNIIDLQQTKKLKEALGAVLLERVNYDLSQSEHDFIQKRMQKHIRELA